MYDFNDPYYRRKVWENIKLGAVVAVALGLLLAVFSCGSESQDTGELFQPVADSAGTLYAYSQLDKIKLNREGKQQAKRAWDSLSTDLLNDSTTQGYTYGFFLNKELESPFSICLTFENDTAYGPSKAQIVASFYPPLSAPERVMYLGSTPVLCFERTSNFDTYGIFTDSLGVIIDHGMREVLSGKGIRFDTNKGPTTKLSPAQAQHYQRTMTAYQATRILHNPLNQ